MDITQLGVGGIFAIMVIKLCFDFVSKRRVNGNGVAGTNKPSCTLAPKMSNMLRMQHDLHEWHKPDAQGEQSWKNHRLSEAIENNTKVLNRLIPILERMERHDNPRI